MENSELVVMKCSGCERKVRTTAARASLGLCSECEKAGMMNLPEPPDSTESEDSEESAPLFAGERRVAEILSTVAMVVGFLSLIPIAFTVISFMAPGGGSPLAWGGLAVGTVSFAAFGWLMATLVRIGIEIANAMQGARRAA